jgi:hypothetical protein
MTAILDTILDTNDLPTPPQEASRYVQVAYKRLIESLARRDCVLVWNLQGYRLEIQPDTTVTPEQLRNYWAIYEERLNNPGMLVRNASNEDVEKDFERKSARCVWIPLPDGGTSIKMIAIGEGHDDAWELLGFALMHGTISWTADKGLYVGPDKVQEFASMIAQSIVNGTFETRQQKAG